MKNYASCDFGDLGVLSATKFETLIEIIVVKYSFFSK